MVRYLNSKGCMTVVALSLAGICAGAGWDGISQAATKGVKQTLLERGQFENPAVQSDEQFDVQEVQGRLTAVAANQVTLQKVQDSMQFVFTPATRVWMGTMETTPASLRPGMPVRIRYLKQDKLNVAKSIRVETHVFRPDLGKAGIWCPYASK